MTDKPVISPGIDTKDLANPEKDRKELPYPMPNRDVKHLDGLRNPITGTYSWDRGENFEKKEASK